MKPFVNIIAATILAGGMMGAAAIYNRQPQAPVQVEPTYAVAISEFFTDPEERFIRSVLYEQMANTLATSPEEIKTTNDLGKVLQRVQLYRFGDYDPEQYAEINQTVGREFARQLGCEDEAQPMDAGRIEIARNFFLDLAEVLSE